MDKLEATLKSLKTGKSRDPENIVNDIFQEGVIGDDLKYSMLLMMPQIKKEAQIPECMKIANITMIHKKR